MQMTRRAEFLLDELRKRGFTGDCLTVCYEPVTGCHVGPGTVGAVLLRRAQITGHGSRA